MALFRSCCMERWGFEVFFLGRPFIDVGSFLIVGTNDLFGWYIGFDLSIRFCLLAVLCRSIQFGSAYFGSIRPQTSSSEVLISEASNPGHSFRIFGTPYREYRFCHGTPELRKACPKSLFAKNVSRRGMCTPIRSICTPIRSIRAPIRSIRTPILAESLLPFFHQLL